MTSSETTRPTRAHAWREVGRFLVTGVANTVIGYGLFVVIQATVGAHITYIGSLLAAHLIASLIAFVLYRAFVFRASGNLFGQFLRFQTVYIVPLAVNVFLLPALVVAFSLNVYLAQGISTVVIAAGSYFAHKYFSFRSRVTRPSTEQPPSPRSH